MVLALSGFFCLTCKFTYGKNSLILNCYDIILLHTIYMSLRQFASHKKKWQTKHCLNAAWVQNEESAQHRSQMAL